MRSVGNFLKEARINQGITKQELGELTHIKVSFINAIETGKWEELPDFGVVTGFVKSISHFLEIDERQAVALLRREYPIILTERIEKEINKQSLNKSEFSKKLRWGPRLTFLTGIIIIILAVLIYLGFQYGKFNSQPSLVVNEPTQNEVVTNFEITVKGKTDPDATVVIDNQPVVTDDDGNFNTQIGITSDTKEVDVVSVSRSGKTTVIKRKIIFKP